jgi:hypothetical protein
MAGVAIIPAQAAKLVEALLEWQQQQDLYEADVVKVGSRMKSSVVATNKFQKRTKMISRSYSGRADGRGPSGVNIEILPIEPERLDYPNLSLSPLQQGSTGSGDLSKTCWSCGEPSHRTDARFCWSCGNMLW